MAKSNVWKFWDKLDEKPPKMICKLCGAKLATNNCGNAKKHLRFKHLKEYSEIQSMDDQSKSFVRHPFTPTKIHKKKSEQKPRLTIDQITALLMPKMETPIVENVDFLSKLNFNEIQSEQSTSAQSTTMEDDRKEEEEEITNGQQSEVSILRKTIRIRAVELVLDIEGADEPVRLSFPCQNNNTDKDIMNILNCV